MQPHFEEPRLSVSVWHAIVLALHAGGALALIVIVRPRWLRALTPSSGGSVVELVDGSPRPSLRSVSIRAIENVRLQKTSTTMPMPIKLPSTTTRATILRDATLLVCTALAYGILISGVSSLSSYASLPYGEVGTAERRMHVSSSHSLSSLERLLLGEPLARLFYATRRARRRPH